MNVNRFRTLWLAVLILTAVEANGRVAEAARICIETGGYRYDIIYVPQDDTFALHGHISETTAMFTGTARVVAGQLLVGLTTIWPLGTDEYADPSSVVWMNVNTGSTETTYLPSNRNVKGRVAIVGCSATPLRPQSSQAGENSKK